MYEKIQSAKQRSHEVAAHIKELIRDEKLKRGEKLPNELELCRSFAVSRPTVREAVKALVSQGILEIRRGKGTFVSQMPGIAEDPLGLDFVMSPDLRLSLIEARQVIEPGVARLATANADEKDLERIAASVRDMEAIVYQHKVGMTWSSISTEMPSDKNPVIMRLVPVIIESIVKTYRDAPRTSEDHRHALEEHTAIYRAIAARDPQAAYAAMQRHLDMSYARTMAKRAARSPEETGNGT
jgi:DNA-binding FadR family transcriptional regulator